MLKRAGTQLGLLLLATDLGLTLLALHLARLLRLALPFGVELDEPLAFSPWHYAIVALIWVAVFVGLRAYDPGRALRYPGDTRPTWVAVTWSTLIFAGINYFFFREFSRFLFAYFYLLDLAFLLGSRAALQAILRMGLGRHLGQPRRVLIAGAGKVGEEIGRGVHAYRWAGLDLLGYVDDDPAKSHAQVNGAPVLGTLDQITGLVRLHSVDEVILALPPYAQARAKQLVLALQEAPVNLRVVPDIFDLVFIRASVEEFTGIPLIGLREPVIEGPERWTKRLFDLLVGGLLLLLALPMLAVVALLVRLDSPGPILFRQERAGENGRTFQMLKFRTMVVGAEQYERAFVRVTGNGVAALDKRGDDPRITRLGRFLRRTSLDELPQLLNVLKGEMSLVGPRPELPWLVETYEPWQRKRFAVPQGMTGWWQVQGRSNHADQQLRVEDDLYYIRNWSVWLDLRILWMTIRAVIKGEGAY